MGAEGKSRGRIKQDGDGFREERRWGGREEKGIGRDHTRSYEAKKEMKKKEEKKKNPGETVASNRGRSFHWEGGGGD